MPLKLEDYSGLAAGATPAEQEPEHESSAEDEQAGARGEERDGTAVDVRCGGTLLDLFRGRRAFHDVPEVAEVLLQVRFRARRHPRGGLADRAARRIPVVHLDLDARAIRRHLLETNLARGLHVAVLGVPPDRLVGLVLGGLGVELGPVTQGPLDHPVRGVRPCRPYLLDVLHELGQVLQRAPVVVDLLNRNSYLYA